MSLEEPCLHIEAILLEYLCKDVGMVLCSFALEASSSVVFI